MQLVHFNYLDLHFLQFPISLLVSCLLLDTCNPCTPPGAPHPPCLPHPHPTPRRHLDIVIIVSFVTLISMLTPLSAQCTVHLCTVQPFFDIVPVLWSQHYSPFAMVPALWSFTIVPAGRSFRSSNGEGLRYGWDSVVPWASLQCDLWYWAISQ